MAAAAAQQDPHLAAGLWEAADRAEKRAAQKAAQPGSTFAGVVAKAAGRVEGATLAKSGQSGQSTFAQLVHDLRRQGSPR